MPATQGKAPRITLPGRMCGRDENNNATNNSVMYRGRPYSRINAIDQEAIDIQREKTRLSWQNGLRTLGFVLTTGKVQVIN